MTTSPSKSSSSRFLLTPLTASQKDQLRKLGRRLLHQALEECDSTTQDENRYWKHFRSSHGLNIFKAKPGAPSDLMISGIVHGKLHDVMTCLHAEDSHTFRVHSALLMPKEFMDGEVLHAIDVADDENPFRFTGLKWCATKWPGSAINKPRDICYFESTGMAQALDSATGQPSTFGYSIMESIHLPPCGPLDDLSIVRAKVSIRRIFRELPIGCTLVMTHCTIDPCGSLSSSSVWRTDVSAMPQLLAITRATDVAQSIWLTQQLHPSMEKRKMSFLAHAVCALCRRDYSKMEKKRVIESNPDGGSWIRATKRHFCTTCLIRSPSKPPRVVPRLQLDDIDIPQADPALTSLTMSRLSSLHLSEYSVETSSVSDRFASVPMLDLDNDDDEADSVYSGLEFDLRSTCQSHLDILEESYEEVEEARAMTPRVNNENGESLSAQLSHLTARMDDTLMLLRHNKTQIDYYRSRDRVEYL
ncbi:unnamed protein product [Aphanomyces euteiches]|uniref:START domain-containing protein n=1 Tax=Aphanomyces euteiches TaxID=100861 RepID=A0A6G0WFM4_9STRA|nr:hypothetical protein Ae201684_016003 [Aphanomyces euteiches]KAH9078291.1 hypothetical protein Ae201684P_019382 [Aphanomyces euteiches]KAH9139188.1 hypothetical protein AeRB84_016537 [Aphanomyces euteiches]KAH9141258.1 hypothetical protein AeRB84_014575 [Aphanomyces euteiches]KAH9151957.1 hypothetical protein AeRB84_005551 [Aphanomyces euteiches]